MTDNPNPAPAPAPAPDVPWHNNDQEIVGYLQNRGIADKPLKEIALLGIKSHREAEKLLGAPKDELVRLPKATDAKDAWKPVWERLGAPADGKYDLSAVKTAKGEPLTGKLAETITGVAAALMLPKDHAASIATAIVRHNEAEASAAEAEHRTKHEAEVTKLKADWGANWGAHMLTARAGAAKLGIDPEAVSALEKMDKVGYAKVMQMFQTIGKAMGEDKYVAGGGGNNNDGTMTVAQAVEKKSELMADDAWRTKYLAGDVEAKRQFAAIMAIIAGANKS